MLRFPAGLTRRLPSFGLLLASCCAMVSLSGCGVGSSPITESGAASGLAGLVHGGNLPVASSNVELFATPLSSSGYGGTAVSLGSTTTDANGNFQFGTVSACGTGQYAYILVAGGNPGLTPSVNNQALVEAAVLGPCPIASGTTVVVNEVTTVAAAYALSGFWPAGGAGITYANIAAGGNMAGATTNTTTNLQGLKDAFANAQNIVSSNSGQAYATTPTGGVVTAATINTVADILQGCVNSGGGANTPCTGTTTPTVTSGLFTLATPPAATGLTAPANTFQAALDIAQYPGNNTGGLYGLMTSPEAFGPYMATAPNDFTVGVTYSNPTLTGALGMAVDANDNVWIGGSVNADVMEFSPQGTMLSPSYVGGPTPTGAAGPQGGWAPTLYQNPSGSGTGDNFRYIAFDPSGNVWLSDGTASGSNTGVYEYAPGGTATSPTAGTLTERSYAAVDTNTNNYTIAADVDGNIWTSTYKASTCSGTTTKYCAVVELVPPATSGAYTAYDTFSTFTSPQPDADGARGIAVDSSSNGLGNVWTTDIGFPKVTLLKTSLVKNGPATATGNAVTTALTPGSGSTDATFGVAIDANSNAWVVGTTTGGIYEVSKAGAQVGSEAIPAIPMVAPSYDVVDGNNNVFVSNQTATSTISAIQEYSIAGSAWVSPNLGYSPGAVYTPAVTSPATPAALTGGSIYLARYIAVDRSGALWALGSGTYAAPTASAPNPAGLVQILGVAAPTDPLLADGKYGVKP